MVLLMYELQTGSYMILFINEIISTHTWNCININQSEASIYSLLGKVSDYSDNLNLV